MGSVPAPRIGFVAGEIATIIVNIIVVVVYDHINMLI
jgi:hypothetical protein